MNTIGGLRSGSIYFSAGDALKKHTFSGASDEAIVRFGIFCRGFRVSVAHYYGANRPSPAE
jgi:hypothetical protein